MATFPTEENFLLNLIVSKFNTQFNTTWGLDDFIIYSVNPKSTHKIGYELKTKLLEDFLTIRVYFNFNSHDEISDFILGLDSSITTGKGNLSDEVYIAFGLIDNFYKENNIYRFGLIDNPLNDNGYIVDHLGNRLVDHLGNYLIY